MGKSKIVKLQLTLQRVSFLFVMQNNALQCNVLIMQCKLEQLVEFIAFISTFFYKDII